MAESELQSLDVIGINDLAWFDSYSIWQQRGAGLPKTACFLQIKLWEGLLMSIRLNKRHGSIYGKELKRLYSDLVS